MTPPLTSVSDVPVTTPDVDASGHPGAIAGGVLVGAGALGDASGPGVTTGEASGRSRRNVNPAVIAATSSIPADNVPVDQPRRRILEDMLPRGDTALSCGAGMDATIRTDPVESMALTNPVDGQGDRSSVSAEHAGPTAAGV
jgi:hypothetical protein